jgi:hypothetical protein
MKNPIVGELVICDPTKMPGGTYPAFHTIREVFQPDGGEADCLVHPYTWVAADHLRRFIWTFAGPVVVDWRERDPSQQALVLCR